MNKVPRFIPLLSDTAAKFLIKDENYRWFYEEIIKYKTGINLEGSCSSYSNLLSSFDPSCIILLFKFICVTFL